MLPISSKEQPVVIQSSSEKPKGFFGKLFDKLSDPSILSLAPPQHEVTEQPAEKEPTKVQSVFLDKLVNKPEDLLDRAGFVRQDKFPQYANLRECPCMEFNRHVVDGASGMFRENLVSTLIERIKKEHPDRNAPLTITSLFSGGCYQELVLLARLVAREGYTNVQFNLIDKGYAKGAKIDRENCGDKYSVEDFISCIEHEILPSFPGAKIKVMKNHDVTKHVVNITKSKVKRPDIMLMIDSHQDEDLTNLIISELSKHKKTSNILLAYTEGVTGFCLSASEASKVNGYEGHYKAFSSWEIGQAVVDKEGLALSFSKNKYAHVLEAMSEDSEDEEGVMGE